jgi:hypothetical protein
MSLVQRRCCKYCDKQITPIDRVITCCPIATLSWDEEGVTLDFSFANGLIKFNMDYNFSPFAAQKQVG